MFYVQTDPDLDFYLAEEYLERGEPSTEDDDLSNALPFRTREGAQAAVDEFIECTEEDDRYKVVEVSDEVMPPLQVVAQWSPDGEGVPTDAEVTAAWNAEFCECYDWTDDGDLVVNFNEGAGRDDVAAFEARVGKKAHHISVQL